MVLARELWLLGVLVCANKPRAVEDSTAVWCDLEQNESDWRECGANESTLPDGWSAYYDDQGYHRYRHLKTGTIRVTTPTEQTVVANSEEEARNHHFTKLKALQALPDAQKNESVLETMRVMELAEALRTQEQLEMSTAQDLEWRVLSEKNPSVYLMENLLSAEECEFMKARATGRMDTGGLFGGQPNRDVRSSDQMQNSHEEERDSAVLRHVYKRVQRVALFADDEAEGMQTGHYDVGEKYEIHLDSTLEGLPRPATMIVYLQDTEEGGATIFPRTEEMTRICGRDNGTWTEEGLDNPHNLTGIAKCCYPHGPYRDHVLYVPPRRGRALMFINHDATTKLLQAAEHGSCPVTKGDKWLMQRWFRFDGQNAVVHGPDPRFDGLPDPKREPPANPLARPGYLEKRVLRNRDPRIYLVEDFLSTEEVQHLRSLENGQPLLEQTTGYRRTYLPQEKEVEDAVVSAVVKRMHRLMHFPEADAEPLQWVAYKAGGSMDFHVDSNKEEQVARPMTALLYLDGNGTLGAGGETVFPLDSCESLLDCCRPDVEPYDAGGPLRIPPKAGSLLLIGNHDYWSSIEPLAAHAACPAGPEGKLVLQRFIRDSAVLTVTHPKDPKFDGREACGIV